MYRIRLHSITCASNSPVNITGVHLCRCGGRRGFRKTATAQFSRPISLYWWWMVFRTTFKPFWTMNVRCAYPLASGLFPVCSFQRKHAGKMLTVDAVTDWNGGQTMSLLPLQQCNQLQYLLHLLQRMGWPYPDFLSCPIPLKSRGSITRYRTFYISGSRGKTYHQRSTKRSAGLVPWVVAKMWSWWEIFEHISSRWRKLGEGVPRKEARLIGVKFILSWNRNTKWNEMRVEWKYMCVQLKNFLLSNCRFLLLLYRIARISPSVPSNLEPILGV